MKFLSLLQRLKYIFMYIFYCGYCFSGRFNMFFIKIKFKINLISFIIYTYTYIYKIKNKRYLNREHVRTQALFFVGIYKFTPDVIWILQKNRRSPTNKLEVVKDTFGLAQEILTGVRRKVTKASVAWCIGEWQRLITEQTNIWLLLNLISQRLPSSVVSPENYTTYNVWVLIN